MTQVLSATEAELRRYIYGPFGEKLYTHRSEETTFSYKGQFGVREMTNTDSLYVMGDQIYDSSLGSFIKFPLLPVPGNL